MALDVLVPQMGESVLEGTILEWKIKVGDKVMLNQVLHAISKGTHPGQNDRAAVIHLLFSGNDFCVKFQKSERV